MNSEDVVDVQAAVSSPLTARGTNNVLCTTSHVVIPLEVRTTLSKNMMKPVSTGCFMMQQQQQQKKETKKKKKPLM